MTAGVQNIELPAYVPPAASASSSDAKGSDTKGGSALDPQTPDDQAEPRDFQTELKRQDTGTKATGPAGPSDTGSVKRPQKRDAHPEEANVTVTPVQVTEPPKQIQPLALALPKQEETPNPDDPENRGEQAGKATQTDPLETSALNAPSSLAAPASPATDPQTQPSVTLQSLEAQQPETRESGGRLPSRNPKVDASSSATPDSSQLRIPLVTPILPVQAPPANSGDQSPAPTTQAATSDSQPLPQPGFGLPPAAPEPATSAIQETIDSAPSSASALAFAARFAAAAPKSAESVSENTAVPANISSSPASQRLLLRYAATAQILPSAGDLKESSNPGVERLARADARTDMVLPRLETSEPSTVSPSAAPQEAAPTARTERVIEPPAPPSTSTHDISVRVPDNNGGATQVRFLESGGEVRVSVRTADPSLAQDLRSHLNDLTQRLTDGGTPAEIWKPGSASASSQNNQQQPDREGRGSGGQQSGGQSGQQDRQEKRPAWLEEMEASMHAEV